jgi:hypothetical protein
MAPMLRVAYHDASQELLIDGHRADYTELRDAILLALFSVTEIAVKVQSAGRIEIIELILRPGPAPNRVSYESGRVIFSIARSLQRQLLSFIQFPADNDLPKTGVSYHHHFDGLADDGTHVAADSLPVVFGLVTD